MKTYRIEWRYFPNSFPEVSYILARSAEKAVETLKQGEGDDIVIVGVEEQ